MKQKDFDIEMMKTDMELARKLDMKENAIGGIRETIASLRNDIDAIYKSIRELEQTIRELEAGKRADRMSANARKIELKRQLDEEGGAI